jgi:hypothetical protein
VRVEMATLLAEYDFAKIAEDARKDWERLVAKMREGDELWRFAPPPGKIRLWGIALVRDGRVISTCLEAID